MLGKLKDLFGSKKPSGAAPTQKPAKMKRVNIDRRFTLISLTGQGSMSTVHKAFDKESQRTICLKVQKVAKHAAVAARASTFERPPEGVIAFKVVHPNVVKTYEFGVTSKAEHFIVMEFIEGASLQVIREAHTADLKEKLELLAQAAEGLAAVHAAGFIHHDIAPKNFLVNPERQVKLIDFGLAIPNTPEFRKPGNRTGTLLYMAPELIRREAKDERIDIFSFGALAFEFLTDRLPYDANEANNMATLLQRINSEPLDPAQANPTLPDPLCDLLRKLTAKRKEDRWPKMANLAEALRDIQVLTRKRK